MSNPLVIQPLLLISYCESLPHQFAQLIHHLLMNRTTRKLDVRFTCDVSTHRTTYNEHMGELAHAHHLEHDNPHCVALQLHAPFSLLAISLEPQRLRWADFPRDAKLWCELSGIHVSRFQRKLVSNFGRKYTCLR